MLGIYICIAVTAALLMAACVDSLPKVLTKGREEDEGVTKVCKPNVRHIQAEQWSCMGGGSILERWCVCKAL